MGPYPNRRKHLLVMAIILALSLGGAPLQAGENPGLDAALFGTGTFAAGKTGVLQVTIQNNLLIESINPSALQLGLTQYFGAAVGVAADLRNEDAPLTVETGRILLGTIPSGGTVPPVPFSLKVEDEAAAGLYTLYLDLSYRVLEEVKVGRNVDFTWDERSQTIELTVEILEEPLKFAVTAVHPPLRPGVKGEISLTFANEGAQRAEKTQARISAVSPISLTDDTAYLGLLEPGEAAVGVFGVKVARDAIPKEYMVTAQVKYLDADGQEILSKKMLFPVEVLPRASFPVEGLKSPLAGGLIGTGITSLLFLGWIKAAKTKRRKPQSR